MFENTFNSITIDHKGIYELAGGRKYSGEKKEHITKVVLKHEIPSKRPVLTIIFGIISSIIGLFGFQTFIIWIRDRDILFFDESLSLLVFLFLGLWLLWSALVKKTILILYTKSKSHKLIFRDVKDKNEVKNFVDQKCKEFDYAYEIMF